MKNPQINRYTGGGEEGNLRVINKGDTKQKKFPPPSPQISSLSIEKHSTFKAMFSSPKDENPLA